jgi:sec-independent protein translocase protein TatA
MGGLTGWHIIAILVIVLLLFGATRLPALARSVGQSMNAFKSEMKKGEADQPAGAEPTVTQAPTVTSAPTVTKVDSEQSADTTPKS